MEPIKEILKILGITVEEMDVNESYTIDSPGPGVMDLTIEKVGPTRLSVAHYSKMRGDFDYELKWETRTLDEFDLRDK